MTEYLSSGNREKCCGCAACEQICPKGAIGMKEDPEGFLYPVLDSDKCVKCGLCKSVCPYDNETNGNEPIKTFAFVNGDKEKLLNSSSGGAFIAIADKILEHNGAVCGCVFDEKLRAVHIVGDDYNTVKRMHGSKYVQSNTQSVFYDIENRLLKGQKVLFSGTPCQVDALKKYLKKDYNELYTVDLICHGVPSPKLLADFIEANSAKAAVTDIKFRDKKRNGWSAAGSISFNKEDKNKTKLMAPYNSAYYNLYFSNSISRPCCYTCRYANINRVGDITIGDYWNIDAVLPAFDSSGGVSVVLVNTQKGAALTKTLKQGSTLVETSLKSAVDGNGNLSVPSKKSGCRDRIFDDIENNGIAAAAKKYCKFKRVKPFIMRHIPKSLKKRVKVKLKKILGR